MQKKAAVAVIVATKFPTTDKIDKPFLSVQNVNIRNFDFPQFSYRKRHLVNSCKPH